MAEPKNIFTEPRGSAEPWLKNTTIDIRYCYVAPLYIIIIKTSCSYKLVKTSIEKLQKLKKKCQSNKFNVEPLTVYETKKALLYKFLFFHQKSFIAAITIWINYVPKTSKEFVIDAFTILIRKSIMYKISICIVDNIYKPINSQIFSIAFVTFSTVIFRKRGLSIF